MNSSLHCAVSIAICWPCKEVVLLEMLAHFETFGCDQLPSSCCASKFLEHIASLHKIIKQCVFVHVGPKNITIRCPNLVQGDSN